MPFLRVSTGYRFGEDGSRDRAGSHPLRRRLRRRDAGHRGPLHQRHSHPRQRPRHASRLPGRDPRACRIARRRVRLPAPLRRPRHPHAGRRTERARRDEPGGAQDEPRRPAAGRHAHRQRGRLRRAQPREGRLRVEPADRRDASTATRSSRCRSNKLTLGRARRGHRPHAEGHAPFEEHVRARPAVVDVLAARSTAARTGSPQKFGKTAGGRRGEHPRVPGRVRVRRDDGDLRAELRRQAGDARARHVPQRHRQHRAITLGLVAASVRSGSELVLAGYPITPASDILHELVAAQVVRDQDDAVRGRDRVGRRCARRIVRRVPSA